MKNLKFKILKVMVVTYLLAHSLTRLLAAVKLIPVADFQLMSGQYFYEGSASSLAGNMFFNITPAVKFNDKFSIIPGFTTSYKATKQLEDLSGGGTLFQDAFDSNASARFIYRPVDNLKLKINSSYKMQLRRETRDEKFGAGLFDYTKFNNGFETEYSFLEKYSAGIGMDYYTLKFPNYESLESQQTADLSRELVGDKVLDSKNKSVSFGGSAKLPLEMKLDAVYIYTTRDFTNQTIVVLSGLLSASKRQDKTNIGSLSLIAPVLKGETLKIIATFDDILTMNDSNQNHYDARKTTFVENYYDYTSNYCNPAFTFMLGEKPYAITLSYGLEFKKYKDRPVQDKNGTYDLTRKVWAETQDYGLSFVYPISEGFKLRTSTTFLRERSNMSYEELFKYKYNSANYLMGFSYEY